MEDEELQRAERWDWDSVERHSGGSEHETVVGVAFSAKEFQQIAAAAEAQGLSTSAYLRRLALAQVVRAAS